LEKKRIYAQREQDYGSLFCSLVIQVSGRGVTDVCLAATVVVLVVVLVVVEVDWELKFLWSPKLLPRGCRTYLAYTMYVQQYGLG
jgi:hypothetical protein